MKSGVVNSLAVLAGLAVHELREEGVPSVFISRNKRSIDNLAPGFVQKKAISRTLAGIQEPSESLGSYYRSNAQAFRVILEEIGRVSHASAINAVSLDVSKDKERHKPDQIKVSVPMKHSKPPGRLFCRGSLNALLKVV